MSSDGGVKGSGESASSYRGLKDLSRRLINLEDTVDNWGSVPESIIEFTDLDRRLIRSGFEMELRLAEVDKAISLS